jgi:hypothetical protein
MPSVEVKVKEVAQEPIKEPEITVDFYPGSSKGGTTSQISWQNAMAKQGLHHMFGVREGESIETVTITRHGITANFRRT